MISKLFCNLALSIGLWLLLATPLSGAPQKQEARITGIVHDVRLRTVNGATHAASANESVREGMTVRTGAASRAEITFADQTIARLGANSVFDFKEGTGIAELKEGTMLLQAPRNAKGAKIHAAGFVVALTGTTTVLESYPTHYKVLVLEGTGRLYRPSHLGDSILVEAGQMVFGQPNSALSDPVDFDIGHFLKTCRFIVDFKPLRSATSMASESQKQQKEKSKKNLIDTNLVILGGGTVVSLVDPAQVDAIGRATSPAATTTSSTTPASADLGTIETSPRPVRKPPSTSSTPTDNAQ
jgi:FecR protein